ncbi:MAG: CehA/McbA family metallohydrolase [Verrucomicrobiota bacterium]|nr:CehA/McbA family metallohydrolase [Verrucomicrobiota bacterium]
MIPPVLAAVFALLSFSLQSAAPTYLILETVDADTGQPIPCLVRITDGKGKVMDLPRMLNRGMGLRKNHPASQWYCHEGVGQLNGIIGDLTIEAFAGPEYEKAIGTEQVRVGQRVQTRLKLKRIANPRKAGWRSGNTHLHLMKLSRAQADHYLRTVPRSDGLELVFVSNLRRAIAEKEYITNEHRLADLKKLESSRLKFGWGQEHRHNYGPGGQGYGHVMLLNIKSLVRPVSIGSGIMLEGTDDPSLQHGIRDARGQEATVVWCHNTFGLEDIPNWISGMLDAQNIFDGGSHDSYEKTYYRYLNVGLRVPFSTGTDWFMYDFSRVYVRMDGKLTPGRWLTALCGGRSYITNGPLLELRCGQNDIEDVIAIDGSRELVFRARTGPQ